MTKVTVNVTKVIVAARVAILICPWAGAIAGDKTVEGRSRETRLFALIQACGRCRIWERM